MLRGVVADEGEHADDRGEQQGPALQHHAGIEHRCGHREMQQFKGCRHDAQAGQQVCPVHCRGD